MPALAKGLSKTALIERIEDLEAEVTALERHAERDEAMYEKDLERYDNQINSLELVIDRLNENNRWLTSDLAKAQSRICQLETR